MDKADLVILMEEAAEITKVAAKTIRFGTASSWNGGPTNKESLEDEVGDLLAMVDRLDLDWDRIDAARDAKHEKLKRFGPEAYPINWEVSANGLNTPTGEKK